MKKKKSKKKSAVYVQSLIGDRVAAVLCGTTYFGIILSSCIFDDGKNYWEIVYDNNFDEEEVDEIELSERQDLYHKEGKNDIVWQQKQNVNNNILTDIYLFNLILPHYCVLLHFFLSFFATDPYFSASCW